MSEGGKCPGSNASALSDGEKGYLASRNHIFHSAITILSRCDSYAFVTRELWYRGAINALSRCVCGSVEAADGAY